MADTEAAKRSLCDIEARHADIIRLESSLKEMQDIFQNIAILVNKQGDLINNIETNVNKAEDCTESSKHKLSNAMVRRRKTRRCKWICMIVAAIAAVILILAIASAIGLT